MVRIVLKIVWQENTVLLTLFSVYLVFENIVEYISLFGQCGFDPFSQHRVIVVFSQISLSTLAALREYYS